MKIICSILRYDYGDRSLGNSFEYEQFYLFLKEVYGNVILFGFDDALDGAKKRKVNNDLLELVKKEKPDLVFFFIYTDQFIPDVLNEIRKYAKTINWFADDKWRFDSFSRHWCRYFDHVVTTDPDAVRKYKETGYNTAVLSQWAINDSVCKKTDEEKKYDVVFVGQFNRYRKWVLKRLRRAGIDIAAFGWDRAGSGNIKKVSYGEMVRLYDQSRIVLNLSNSINWDVRFLLGEPMAGLSYLKGCFQGSLKNKEDIKARFFEATGCGSFLLSYYVDHLEDYFVIGREMAIYTDIDNMIDKIKYYLKDEGQREQIAHSGYVRTLSDHTYRKRFAEIFKAIGL
ncbi:MAG: glycosyltransferase [Deltaproteobacteria bacterium]|nr:glycosyltransferase [Deltaproteobacteria bacterium]MCL5277892.1 glycosyltransferase [Deltaproteobacteria bacterium]